MSIYDVSHGEFESLLKEAKARAAIVSIASDSRKVHPKSVFFALPATAEGGKDGFEYILNAAKGGASWIVVPIHKRGLLDSLMQEDKSAFDGIDIFCVEDTRICLGMAAKVFFPSYDEADDFSLIGITGTNGKTTITYLIESILSEAGVKCGVIGTVSVRYPHYERQAQLTTPDAITIHQAFHEMKSNGVSVVAMEVSSHALQQKRVAGCCFKASIFTNLTREHLDYHVDMEGYFQAKEELFKGYTQGASIINLDDAYGRRLFEGIQDEKIGYGFHKDAAVRGENLRLGLDGFEMDVVIDLGKYLEPTVVRLRSPLLGRHNASNSLAAIAACISLGIEVSAIQKGIGALQNVPGRLERVEIDDVVSLVDYAHTPDALENVLKCLKDLTKGRLFCVIGCGGDRDKGKRPLMAQVAVSHADKTIFTSDNPRSEDPETIIEDMLKGLYDFNPNGKSYYSVKKRELAIQKAVWMSSPGDCILVAGKGHETYQVVGGEKRSFDDRIELKKSFQLKKTLCEQGKSLHLGWKLADIATAVNARIACPFWEQKKDSIVPDISTDSRTIRVGEIFWAIKGERFDGACYAKDAIEKGASAVVASEAALGDLLEQRGNCPVLVVKDSLEALGEFASWHQRRLGLRVVGVTGSCGKTTTKELIADFLQIHCKTLRTMGNFNNQIGLPLTLLKADPSHEWAVLEMGMNQPGEIGKLCKIALPEAGIITNVQPVHLEGLGSIEAVADEKASLFRALPKRGLAVVNLDDAHVVHKARDIVCKKVGYSFGRPCDEMLPVVRLLDWKPVENGTQIMLSLSTGEVINLTTSFIGEANIRNIVASFAMAFSLGITPAEIANALLTSKPVAGRLSMRRLAGDIWLIDDIYNANPASVELSLDCLGIWGKGAKVAILGDMLELGEKAADFHRQIGKKATSVKPVGLDGLLVAGRYAKDVIKGFEATEGSSCLKVTFETTDELVQWLVANAKEFFQEPVTLLVKGSRGMRLEKVTGALDQLLTVPEDKLNDNRLKDDKLKGNKDVL